MAIQRHIDYIKAETLANACSNSKDIENCEARNINGHSCFIKIMKNSNFI